MRGVDRALTTIEIEQSLRRSGHDDLADTVPKIELFLTEWWRRGAILYWFTDHGPEHSRRVADLALSIADIPTLPLDIRLTSLEKYVLWSAALLHDVGMQSLLGQAAGTQNARAYERIRHEHPNESRNVINAQWRQIGLPDDLELVGAIALVARAHGTKYYRESIELLEGADQLHGERVRTALLAATLLIADELDLDVRRVVPPPANQPLGTISQAHAAKHRMVNGQSIEHGTQGRVGFNLHLSSNGCPEAQAAAVEKWIVEKLRIQMALVEPAFINGFAGHAELDRNIRVIHHQSLVPPAGLPAEVLAIIEDEVASNELIDHKRNERELEQTIHEHGVAVITGRMDAFEDIDGREDLTAAALAQHRGRGGTTIASRVLYETGGAATLRDMLRELCSQAGLAPQTDGRSSEELFQLFFDTLSDSTNNTVVWISSIDWLAPEEVQWVRDSIVSRLHSLDHVTLFFTADSSVSLCGADGIETIRSYGMEIEEVEAYLSRYVSGRPARVEALQKLRYSRYKRMRQDYLADMMTGV